MNTVEISTKELLAEKKRLICETGPFRDIKHCFDSVFRLVAIEEELGRRCDKKQVYGNGVF